MTDDMTDDDTTTPQPTTDDTTTPQPTRQGPAALNILDGQEERLREEGWPPALAKATVDPFMYAIGLRGGLVITFRSATDLDNGFVALHGIGFENVSDESVFAVGGHAFRPERGLEVRVHDVVWALDAPFGS